MLLDELLEIIDVSRRVSVYDCRCNELAVYSGPGSVPAEFCGYTVCLVTSGVRKSDINIFITK